MSKFQIILLSVFGVAIILAVAVFSLYRGSSSSKAANVTIWGTLPSYSIGSLVVAEGFDKQDIHITYVEKSPSSFESDFTEALAEGKGPDIVLLPENEIWANRNKLLPIPYTSVSQKDFQSTFVDEANLFLSSTGAYALPLYMDPYVMYWNREILSSAAIAKPLEYWDEIYGFITKLTQKDNAGNLKQTTMALGESQNIPHSEDILSLLLLQAGTPITELSNDGTEDTLFPTLNENFGLPETPGIAALNFYTQFSDPSRAFYTWNRSLPSAAQSFVSGDSAFYLAPASEYKTLQSKNPTLSIAISRVPQSRVANKVITTGRIYGLAMVKASPNPAGNLRAILALISGASAKDLSGITGLPPARRDLLAVRPGDASQAVFFDAAIQSRSWMNPDSTKSGLIFGSLIDSVTSGRASTNEALNKANEELRKLTE